MDRASSDADGLSAIGRNSLCPFGSTHSECESVRVPRSMILSTEHIVHRVSIDELGIWMELKYQTSSMVYIMN